MKLKRKDAEIDKEIITCDSVDDITTSNSTLINKDNFHDFHRTPHHTIVSLDAFGAQQIWDYNKDNRYTVDVDENGKIGNSNIDVIGDNALAGFIREDAIIGRLYIPREFLLKADIVSTDPMTVLIDKNLSVARE